MIDKDGGEKVKLNPNENAGKIIQRHEDAICETEKDLTYIKKALRILSYAALGNAVTLLLYVVAFVYSVISD